MNLGTLPEFDEDCDLVVSPPEYSVDAVILKGKKVIWAYRINQGWFKPSLSYSPMSDSACMKMLNDAMEKYQNGD